MSEEKLDAIIKEIKISRNINEEEHKQILGSAEATENLTELIQGGITAWIGFRKVIMGIRSFLILIGAVVLSI